MELVAVVIAAVSLAVSITAAAYTREQARADTSLLAIEKRREHEANRPDVGIRLLPHDEGQDARAYRIQVNNRSGRVLAHVEVRIVDESGAFAGLGFGRYKYHPTANNTGVGRRWVGHDPVNVVTYEGVFPGLREPQNSDELLLRTPSSRREPIQFLVEVAAHHYDDEAGERLLEWSPKQVDAEMPT